MRPATRPIPTAVPALVLLAEDDPELRALIARALRRDGYDVVPVPDGAELLRALDALRAHGREVDLIVSDLRMPGMTGLEAIRRLRAGGARARIVMVTAFPDERTITEARDAGVAHVIAKPFDLDDLRTVAMHVLAA